MKHLTSIFVFLLVPLSLLAKPTYDELSNHTVYIEGKSDRGGYLGTGVVIQRVGEYDYVLTNRHIADGALELKIENLYRIAEIIAISDTVDLALLRVRNNNFNKTPVKGLRYPKIGDSIYTVGHGLGLPYNWGEGVVSGFVTVNNVTHLYLQLPSIGGQSGSGIFDNNGYLVGILWGGWLVPLNIFQSERDPRTCCVRGEDIFMFLIENGIAFEE